MESTRLRNLAIYLKHIPASKLHIILEKIVKPLLARVNAPKDDYFIFESNGRMPVSRLGSCAFDPPYFKPQIAQERVLVDIIHSVMAIPPSNHKHHIITHNS